MIIPYRARDLDDIDLTPEHRTVAETARGALNVLSAARWASTSVAPKSGIVAILGLVVGVSSAAPDCEVFIFPSVTLARKHPFILFKDVSKELERIRKSFRVVRAISKDEPRANRFLAHLGFTREGRRPTGHLAWVYR